MGRQGDFDPAWLEAVAPFMPGSPSVIDPLSGGDDAETYRLRGGGFDLVLQALPSWTSPNRLEWVHEYVRRVHSGVSEAVAPLDLGGASFLWAGGRFVTMAPFVDGNSLDRENEHHRSSSARVLARIHRISAELEIREPPPFVGGPIRPRIPAQLEDATLDEWWSTAKARLTRGPTHGDYYRANLLCDPTEVVGVLDWSESAVQPFLVEVAGAMFEMCRDEAGVLDRTRSAEFLDAYRSADPPVPDWEFADLNRAMRLWLRRDALTSMSYSGGVVSDYARGQIRAFEASKGLGSESLM